MSKKSVSNFLKFPLKFFIVFLFLVFFSVVHVSQAHAAIAFDNAAGPNSSGGGQTIDITFSVGSGTNRMLFVAVTSPIANTVTATYNSVSMTSVKTGTFNFGSTKSWLFALVNPSSGSHTIHLDAGSAVTFVASASSYSGVNQSTTMDASITSTSDTAQVNRTESVTTVADNTWTLLFGISTTTVSAGTGSTLRTSASNVYGIFDSNGAITPAGSHSMTYNFSNGRWGDIMVSFAPATASTITVSGTIYSDEGSTVLTTTPTVRVKVNGAGTYSAVANSSGVYSIAGITITSAGDVVTAYLSGATAKAVVVTRAADTTSNITGLNLYQNEVIVRHEDAGPITNTNLSQYYSSSDADIKFTVTAGALTVSSGNTLYIWSGKTFAPGGNVTTPSLKIIGTYNNSTSNPNLTVNGSFTNSSTGTFTKGTGTLTFSAGASQTLTDSNATKQDLGTVVVAKAASPGISSSPVQQVTGTASTGTTVTVTLTSTPTNGNVLVAFVVSAQAGLSGSSISETGVTWHKAISTNVNKLSEIWYGEVGSGASTTVTITMSATLTVGTVSNVSEWSGVAVSSELDASGSANGNNTAPTTATITPAPSNNELLMAVYRGGNISTGPTNSFTALSTLDSGAQMVYRVVSSTSGTYSTAWTSASQSWDAQVASFVAAGTNTTLSLGSSVKMTALTINASQVFTANGSNTLTITGTGTASSRPLINNGTFTQSTGTVEYTGTATTDISDLTSDSITYNNLTLDPAGTVTYNLGTAASQTLTVNGALTIGNGTNAVTVTVATNNPTINLLGNVTIAASAIYTKGSGTTTFKAGTTQTLTDNTTAKQDLGAGVVAVNGTNTTLSLATSVKLTSLTINASQTFTANGSNTLTITGTGTVASRPLINNGTFTQSTGTVEFTGTATTDISDLTSDSITYNNLTLDPAGTVTYNLGSATSQTLTINGTLTIGNGSNAVTATAATYNPTINLLGNVTIAASAIYTKGSGTTTFKAGTTQTLTDNTTAKQDLGAGVVAGAPASGFSYSRSITIDHTKAGSTDSSNFPVLVSGTYSYLATVANGGKVTNASGYDIGFYSDSALTTKLSWETVVYTATSGLVVYFVKVPTVSHTVDTIIYMAYGNATISTDQSNKTGTWDANFKAVYHFGDGTTLSLLDSTSNGNTLTNIGTATATAGPFGGAVAVNGSSSYLRRLTSVPVTADPITFSALFNPSSTADAVIVEHNQQSAVDVGRLSLGIRSLAQGQFARTTMDGNSLDSSTTYTTSAWNYATGRGINTSSRTIQLNGATGVNSTTTGTAATPDDLVIGARYGNSVASNFFPGSIAEVRISNVDRGADWATTEYNNLISPSTFYTLGAEAGPGGNTTLSLATSVKLTSLTINASQTFTANGSNTLTITGTGTVASRPLINNGTFTQSTGTVEFTGTATTDISDLTSDSITYNNLTLDPAGTVTYNLGSATSQTFTVNGTLTAGNGTNALTLAGGTYNPTFSVNGLTIAASSAFTVPTAMTLTGNFTNNGTFTHNSGTLTLVPSGSSITINGTSNITFNNFTIAAANGANKALMFKNGNTYTFAGAFNIAGQSGNILALSSTTAASQWIGTFNSTGTVTYTSVKDSGCSLGNSISNSYTMVNLGNNGACWTFLSLGGGGGGVETSATPNAQVTGGGVSAGGGGGTTAGGTAVLTSGAVSSVTITSAGSGYASPPSVSFCGGGGSGATGTAVLTSGAVTSVTIGSGGSLYTSPPTVVFGGACGGGAGASGGDSGFLYGNSPSNNLASAIMSGAPIDGSLKYLISFLLWW